MPMEDLPVFSFYDKQRFVQFGSQDCANWYAVQGLATKKQQALYPAMGRKHIHYLSRNQLVFDREPRKEFKTIDYMYFVVGNVIHQYDRFYNHRVLTNINFNSVVGDIWFDYLKAGNLVFGLITADTSEGRKIFVIEESENPPVLTEVTDSNAPENPTFVAAFGNRFTVSEGNSSQFNLSAVNLGGAGFDPTTCFTVDGIALFAQASGRIGQFAVLHNQLYIFTDFNTDVWSNIPSQVFDVTFPWKLNSSYNFDYGIADPNSLDTDFGMMVWLGKNRNGLVTFMVSTGQSPQPLSTQAINVLLENAAETNGLSPFLQLNTQGFLYQYENTIFYRASAGQFLDFGQLDIEDSANSIEYNFDAQRWHRCIELNGERNRIQRHVFFNNIHYVTVLGDTAVYNMSGKVYYNEHRNPEQDNPQASDAFIKEPMRYEMITRQIYNDDYSEFVTDYVEIDFVFGDQTFNKNTAPFDNTVFILAEESTPDNPIYLVTEDSTPGNETFIIAEEGDTPGFDDNHYYELFKPHIELYYSDDGGVTFESADLREFSPLGAYRWRMRWYQLGASRNRCYKLVCVSSAPVVILGGTQNRRRVSGGAN